MAGSKFNNVVGEIKTIANGVTSGISKVKSIVSDPGATASSIRDKYLSGFLGDTMQFTPSVFPRLFDEPTYLTFRIEFNTSPVYNRNISGVNTIANGVYSYDYLPEPLLTKNEGNAYQRSFTAVDQIHNTADSKMFNYYSTSNYLHNVLGETRRGEMLDLLIDEIDDIQNNYPYYFTSISGLNSLAKVDTKKGIRLDPNTKIRISCLEGLDLKITQLMQLYRKIAWDDVYQRWILPDMMRFFNMKIYVSEIRLFHTSSVSLTKATHGRLYDFAADTMNNTIVDGKDILGTAGSILSGVSVLSERLLGADNKFNKVLGTVENVYETGTGIYSDIVSTFSRMCNNAINDVMPTICFDCHLCEFDIEDTLSHISRLSSANRKEAAAPQIVIKVGQVEDIQMYPLNGALKKNDGEDRYSIEFNDRRMAAGYISDDILVRDNTIYGDRNYMGDDRRFKDEMSVSAAHARMGKKMIDLKKDSYSKDGSSREMAIGALAAGALNVVEEYTPYNNKGGARSAATRALSEDERSSLGFENPTTNVPRSRAVNEKYADMSLEGVGKGYESTATTYTSPGGKVIADYELIELSAATRVLDQARESILESNALASINLSDDEKRKLAAEMYKEVLVDIVQSPATQSGLRDMASLILDAADRDAKSTAVDKDYHIDGIDIGERNPNGTAADQTYNAGIDRGKVFGGYDDVEISHAVKHKHSIAGNFSALNTPYISEATAPHDRPSIDVGVATPNGTAADDNYNIDRKDVYDGDYDNIDISHATSGKHSFSERQTDMPRRAESTATDYAGERPVIDVGELDFSHATHADNRFTNMNSPMPRELPSEAVDASADRDNIGVDNSPKFHATNPGHSFSKLNSPMPRKLPSTAVDSSVHEGNAFEGKYNDVEVSHATKPHKDFK